MNIVDYSFVLTFTSLLSSLIDTLVFINGAFYFHGLIANKPILVNLTIYFERVQTHISVRVRKRVEMNQFFIL